MVNPLQITFRGMDPSDAVTARIEALAGRLDRFSDRITSCHVVFEQESRRHQHGDLFHVHIDITLPGAEVVVDREAGVDHSHEDAYVALRDAFDHAVRRVEEHMRTHYGRGNRHEAPPEPT